MNLVFVVCLFICSRWLPGDSLVCYGRGLVLSRGCCLCHGLVASVHTSCVGFVFARFVGSPNCSALASHHSLVFNGCGNSSIG